MSFVFSLVRPSCIKLPTTDLPTSTDLPSSGVGDSALWLDKL
jgi:hypothetical protein